MSSHHFMQNELKRDSQKIHQNLALSLPNTFPLCVGNHEQGSVKENGLKISNHIL